MQTEFTVYRGPELWARIQTWLPLAPNMAFTVTLRGEHPDAREWNNYEVNGDMAADLDITAGWVTIRARLVINGGSELFTDLKPLTFYVDEPTDWHSGIARWDVPGRPADPRGIPAVPPARWTVTARRAS
jgi:hypothetical protein